jgi:hypothetical protein
MTHVLADALVISPFRVTGLFDAYLCRHGLEFAVSVDFAGCAVERVIGEDQLDDVPPQPLNILSFRVNVPAVLDPGMAAGHGSCLSSLGKGHIHAAYTATAEGLQVRSITKRRNNVSGVPAHEGQNRLIVKDGKGFSVDMRLSPHAVTGLK